MKLMVEVEGEGMQGELPGGGAALVALMSFSVSRGFGATHPLIALADRLHDVHRVRLGPLTTFYDGTIEDSEDAEKLELAWQGAGELRESLEGVGRSLENDEQCRLFVRRAAAEGLVGEVAAVLQVVRRAEEGGARVRLSYSL
jgi:hypothetical protein